MLAAQIEATNETIQFLKQIYVSQFRIRTINCKKKMNKMYILDFFKKTFFANSFISLIIRRLDPVLITYITLPAFLLKITFKMIFTQTIVYYHSLIVFDKYI